MSYDRSYSRTATTSNRNRRPLYAPPAPPSSGRNNRHHSVLGFWVPVIVTSTIALGGLAAWIWSERNDHDDDDHYPQEKPPQRPQYPPGPGSQGPQGGRPPFPPGPGSQGPYPGQQGAPGQYQGPPPGQGPSMPPPVGGEAASYYSDAQSRQVQTEREETSSSGNTWFGQMRGAMRRTPSPQQFFDSATKQVTAGMAAAGAALGSILEEDGNGHAVQRDSREGREEREGFSDHERWSEEADDRQKRDVGIVEAESEKRAYEAARSGRDDKGKGRAKRSVAVVVSADVNMHGHDQDEDVIHTEHASILSHLPAHHDPSRADLYVLIYCPNLTSLPPLTYRPNPSSTLDSSYSQINTPAVTPGSELQSISPRIDPQSDSSFTSPSRSFDALWQQALTLVSSPSQILPFTTPTGYIHILRHLAPQLTYVSDTLAGHNGESVAQLKGWVGHTILVVGDEGHGGLADTETEAEDEQEGGKTRWWDRSSFVGLGKEVEVVDASRVGEDWSRRVGGRE